MMYFETWLWFCIAVLTGYAIIVNHEIGQIFKKSREDINPLTTYVDAMHAHDKEEAEG